MTDEINLEDFESDKINVTNYELTKAQLKELGRCVEEIQKLIGPGAMIPLPAEIPPLDASAYIQGYTAGVHSAKNIIIISNEMADKNESQL